MPSNRRTLLAGLGGAAAALAGCTTVEDTLRSTPDRTVAADWQPPPGTWPATHYDPANTRHNPHATPPRERPTAAWAEDVGDEVGAVVVGEKRVYAATERAVLALDAADGSRRWTRGVDGTHRLQYVDGRLYELGSRTVRARTPDGRRRWATALSSWPHSLHERDGYVFVGRQGGYSTLHADTGEVVRNRQTWIEQLAVDRESVYGNGLHQVGGYTARRRAVDEDWRTSVAGPYHTHGTPTLSEDVLYQPERALAGSESPAGRVTRYTTDGRRAGELSFGHVPSGLAVAGGTAFVGTATVTAGELGVGGRVIAVDGDGERRWEFDPESGVVAPVVANGTVYVGPFGRSTTPLVAFDAASGARLWERDVSGSVVLAAAGERLYVGDGERVVALRA